MLMKRFSLDYSSLGVNSLHYTTRELRITKLRGELDIDNHI